MKEDRVLSVLFILYPEATFAFQGMLVGDGLPELFDNVRYVDQVLV